MNITGILLSKAVLLDQSDEPELSRLFCAETVDGLNINWHRPLRVCYVAASPCLCAMEIMNIRQCCMSVI